MGHVLMIIFSLLLAIVVVASGAGKFRRAPQVMAAMRHIRINKRVVAILAGLEVIGGVGLLIGLVSSELGEIASSVLAAYFLFILIAHRRVQDHPSSFAPAIGIFLFSVVTAILQFVR